MYCNDCANGAQNAVPCYTWPDTDKYYKAIPGASHSATYSYYDKASVYKVCIVFDAGEGYTYWNSDSNSYEDIYAYPTVVNALSEK